jgi:geranylgeranylglycerol-phosphate geranylgeranyltransferase
MKRSVGGFTVDTSTRLMRNKFFAWIRISRPLIVFISVFGASVGALNVTIADISVNDGVSLNTMAFTLTLASAALLSAGLMIHNDYTDLESDRVNRPQKPIPSGLISPLTAKWTGMALMGASVLVAFSTTLPTPPSSMGPLAYGGLNLPCGILTLIIVLSGIFYNARGKYTGIWGHVIVAFGVGAIPLWGAWAVRSGTWTDLKMIIPLAAAIFAMEIGREIMVCIGDIHGDQAAGFLTTPVRLGRKLSMYLVLLFYTMFIPLYPIPFLGILDFPKVFGIAYLIGATLFLIILYVTWLNVMRVMRGGNEKKIWHSFELNIRTGTRIGVVLFQILLFVEAFI